MLDDQPAPALGARLFASSRAVSDYFGLRLSRKQAMRALRTTLAVLLACGLGIAAEHTELLPRGTPIFVFWSPVTVVVCLGDALDAPTYARLSQRMVGTLLGAVFALLLVGLIDETTILCILAAWVVLMSYYRAVGEQSYWAFVSALTAPLLLLVAVPSGAAVASALVVARVLFTAIGLACIIIVYGVLLPVSTRALVCEASHATVVGLRAAAADAVAAHVAGLRTREAAVAAALRLAQAVAAGEPPPPPPPRPPPALDPAAILTELNAVGKSVASLTGLVAMASFEPQLWRTPFPLQERHYAALGVHTRHAAVAARSMLQAATSLAASRRAMPPLLCAAPLRDSPVAAAGSPLPAAVVAALAAVAAGARAADAGALLLVGVAAELDATASAIDEVLALSEILLVPSEQWPWRSATARASAAMRRRRAAAASEALSSAVDAMERALQAKTRAYDRLLGAFAAAVHSDAAAATAAGDAAAAARSMTALRVLATTDALCLSAASFALFDLSTAAAAVAASARRLWHAQEESGSTLFA